MKTNYLGLIVVLIVLAGIVAYAAPFVFEKTVDLEIIPPVGTTTSRVVNDKPTTPPETPDKIVATLKLNEKRTIGGTTIEVSKVLEDSRCAKDVQCVWAGQVRIEVKLNTPSGNSTTTLMPGKFVTTETLKITLEDVTPYPISTRRTEDSEYRFRLLIEKHDPGNVSAGKCFVGGCSGQICSGEEGMASTCEYRESYACYQTARCERQTSGECGWTQTPELKTCLNKSM